MMHNNFNPFGDLPEMPTPKPDNLTDEERMQLATATLLGGCATTAAAIVIAIVLCLLFCSCTTTRYVPVNETRTEHHWHTDSVHQTDTVPSDATACASTGGWSPLANWSSAGDIVYPYH